MKRKLTVYQRLMRAVRGHKGIRLTPDEVWELCSDDAISTRAEKDDLNDAGTKDEDVW